MNLVSCDVTSVLKFIQTITGIKGYTTRRRQETTPPFFYLQTPVGKPYQDSVGFHRYRPLIHGTLFLDKDNSPETQALQFQSKLQDALMRCRYDIPLVDENFNSTKARLEDVEIEVKQADVDVWNITAKGERFIELVEHHEILRKVHNNIRLSEK
ncbi:hypothetical protein PDJ96_14640 [Bacillus cereus group sp. BY17LC]|uniref:hypothetical protein n=1 Tax=Bacillus TaxID=1386 RepID=UPI0022E31E8F|nr:MULTISPECIES: hypothetical protein [unclassified Bacillus cereus group]MDA1577285.1 hypothetical protein [Bacillus cereus group sp. TH228LC]MDA1837955.1 hypothetical protein [Bacillus cereus group sp. BY17LC]